MTRAEDEALKNHTIIGFGPYEIERLKEEFLAGYNQAQQDYIEYAQLWVDSGEVNIKSFKQFLKDRGYE